VFIVVVIFLLLLSVFLFDPYTTPTATQVATTATPIKLPSIIEELAA
jgi:hypothetical protein